MSIEKTDPTGMKVRSELNRLVTAGKSKTIRNRLEFHSLWRTFGGVHSKSEGAAV